MDPDDEEFELAQRALELEEADTKVAQVHLTMGRGVKVLLEGEPDEEEEDGVELEEFEEDGEE